MLSQCDRVRGTVATPAAVGSGRSPAFAARQTV